MRGWAELGRTLLGAIALSALVAGCATQRDDSLRLSEELGRAHADSAWQRARAAELEARMSQLEQRSGAAQTMQRNQDRDMLNRLERLIEMNERLLAEHATPAPLAAASTAPVPAPAPAPVTAPAPASATKTAATPAPALSDEQALRELVERLRGRPGRPHGGLTREQEQALRVLLQPERTLDTENPWPAAFY